MEGMAEYLSVGPIDPHTAMWLRDAALEGHLPTTRQLTYDEVFPYYFGHAIWAYIGEKWGDEAIGEILQASVSSGVEGAVKRALGISLDDLFNEWRDAVQTTYLPQLAEHYKARRIAQPVLTKKRSDGTLHLAPALSPDGRDIAYFSERNSFFVDLYLADAETGRVKRRLVNEQYAGPAPAWSPAGKTIAFTTDRGGETDFGTLKFGNMRIGLYHLDDGRIELLKHMDQGKNINPVWAPDGRSLAFVSDRGDGISNIFLYDFTDSNIYQLTDVYTGVTGITPLSPCLSWAHEADRLAFAYYEEGEYNVYGLDNPRSLKRQPYQPPANPPVASLLAAQRRDRKSVV